MAAESTESTTTARLIIQTENGDEEGKPRRPKEPWKGEYVKCIVYGGLDAIITCFSLISSLSASKRSSGYLSSLSYLFIAFCFFIFIFDIIGILII